MIFPVANPDYQVDNLDSPPADPDLPAANRSNSATLIVSALNFPGSFTGRINNSANIGMTSPEMAALWNEKNPDNPIVLEPAPEPQ